MAHCFFSESGQETTKKAERIHTTARVPVANFALPATYRQGDASSIETSIQ
jgi:hypothetical protein